MLGAREMSIYVRLFVAIAVPCAIAIMALLALASFVLKSATPWTTWALLGAELGAGFAVLAAAGLGTAHRACVRDLPFSGVSDAYDLTNVRGLTVDLTYEEALVAFVGEARRVGRETG